MAKGEKQDPFSKRRTYAERLTEPSPTPEKTGRKKTSITLSPEALKALEDLRYRERTAGRAVTYSDLIERAILELAKRELPKPVEE